MDTNELSCSVCGVNNGTFTVEDDELVLNFRCGHESAGLVMNLSLIGEESEVN